MKKGTKGNRYKSVSRFEKVEKMIQVVEPLAPEDIAHKLESFSVTVDSVVATAILVVNERHAKVSVNWGDDIIEVINVTSLRLLSPKLGGVQDLNTIKLQHVYQAPFNYGRRIIIATITDLAGGISFDTAVIEIERRYKLSYYSTILEFPNHLDSIFETTSEIEAKMIATQGDETILSRNWKADVVTAPNITTGDPIQLRLNQSNFTREMSYFDEPIEIDMELSEDDGPGKSGGIIDKVWSVISAPIKFLNMFPLSTNPGLQGVPGLPNPLEEMPLKIHPRTSVNMNVSTAVFHLPLDRGVIVVWFNYELNLVVPVDKTFTQVMTAT